jgi:hypothetical protein
MIPFYEAYSPAQMAYATALDTIWVIGFVLGWCIALWQHFTAPTIVPPSPMPQIDPVVPSVPDRVVRKRSPLLSSTVSIG